jgi:23S rRNA A1618 N6-methylase RlmF
MCQLVSDLLTSVSELVTRKLAITPDFLTVAGCVSPFRGSPYSFYAFTGTCIACIEGQHIKSSLDSR